MNPNVFTMPNDVDDRELVQFNWEVGAMGTMETRRMTCVWVIGKIRV
jgi:hypothetical protein